MTLKQLIDSNTVTHERLATRIGVHPSALSFWYHGKRKMTADNAQKIADHFRMKAVVKAGQFQFEKR